MINLKTNFDFHRNARGSLPYHNEEDGLHSSDRGDSFLWSRNQGFKFLLRSLPSCSQSFSQCLVFFFRSSFSHYLQSRSYDRKEGWSELNRPIILGKWYFILNVFPNTWIGMFRNRRCREASRFGHSAPKPRGGGICLRKYFQVVFSSLET